MPMWAQPLLRAKQVALEKEGLIQTRDSTLITIIKTKEALGLQVKPTLPGIQHNLRGNQHVANNEL